MTANAIPVQFDGLRYEPPADSVKRTGHDNGIGIVEDEAELTKVLTKLFNKHRVKVCFTAYDGIKAIEIVKSSAVRPKVLLMDYRLLNMNGVDTMKEIMKVDPEIRFVFLSADADAKDEALKAGAMAFLKKPATARDILTAVNRALS